MGKFPKLKGVTICDCFFFSPNYSSKLQEIKRKLYNTQQHSIFQDTVPKLLLFLVLFSHTDLTLANHIVNANVHVCNHWCYNISLFSYIVCPHITLYYFTNISQAIRKVPVSMFYDGKIKRFGHNLILQASLIQKP